MVLGFRPFVHGVEVTTTKSGGRQNLHATVLLLNHGFSRIPQKFTRFHMEKTISFFNTPAPVIKERQHPNS